MSARFDPPDGQVHDGHRSWWDGSFRALCGRRFVASSVGRWEPWARVTCPGCVAAKR